MTLSLPFKLTLLTSSMLLLAACNRQTAQTTSQPTDGTMTADSMDSRYQEWANAIASGQALRCTMTNTEANQSINYLVQGEKFNMHLITTNDQQQNMNNYGISDGEYMYIWEGSSNQGMKMSLQTPEEQPAEAQERLGEIPDFSSPEKIEESSETGYNIDCQPATASQADFTPPANVTFTDLSQVMQQSMEKVPTDSMSDEEKAQLEEAMKQFGNQGQ